MPITGTAKASGDAMTFSIGGYWWVYYDNVESQNVPPKKARVNIKFKDMPEGTTNNEFVMHCVNSCADDWSCGGVQIVHTTKAKTTPKHCKHKFLVPPKKVRNKPLPSWVPLSPTVSLLEGGDVSISTSGGLSVQSPIWPLVGVDNNTFGVTTEGKLFKSFAANYKKKKAKRIASAEDLKDLKGAKHLKWAHEAILFAPEGTFHALKTHNKSNFYEKKLPCYLGAPYNKECRELTLPACWDPAAGDFPTTSNPWVVGVSNAGINKLSYISSSATCMARCAEHKTCYKGTGNAFDAIGTADNVTCLRPTSSEPNRQKALNTFETFNGMMGSMELANCTVYYP